jgi:hypothetical protein
MNYKGMDYWVAIRDNEEILFAPKIHTEKNLGFYTTNPKLFEMFHELVKQKIFSKLKAEEFET